MHVNDIYDYVSDVLSGKIIAGKFVKMACERFEADDKRPDLYFNKDRAKEAIEWFKHLRHVKGEWAKPPAKTIELEPWECFVTGSLFGWEFTKTKLRRFKTGYIEIGRKNAKTTLAAGWGGYLFLMDYEHGAEVYSAATTREQAKIVFGIFREMVRRDPHLSAAVDSYKNNMSVPDTFSKFEPLSSDYNTLDGLNTSGSICDEVHAWPVRDLWDVIEESTAAREQPLQIAITTAGSDQTTICYELRDWATGVLKKTIEDDSFFGIIYAIDSKLDWPDLLTPDEVKKGTEGTPEDDWRVDIGIQSAAESKVWIKANPNLGVSVKLDYLNRKARKAAKTPALQNSFLRKHMNLWTQQYVRWIDLALWDSNFSRKIYEMEE